jgi:hypothetical protein
MRIGGLIIMWTRIGILGRTRTSIIMLIIGYD